MYKLDCITIHNMIIETSINKKTIHRMGEILQNTYLIKRFIVKI